MRVRIQTDEKYPFYHVFEDDRTDWFEDEIVFMEKEDFERFKKAFDDFEKIQDELRTRLKAKQEDLDHV